MGSRTTIGGIRRDLVKLAFCDYFGIGDARADLLVVLYERQGEPIRPAPFELGKAMDSHRRPTMGAIQESVHILRAVMASEAIDRDERGYFLSEIGLDECRKALRESGEALVQVGSAA